MTAAADPAIQRVGVVGCGLMGSGIAEVCARAGLDVVVREVDTDAVAAGKARIVKSLERARRKGKLSDEDAVAALARIRFTTDFADLADRQLVLEAVSESEPLKLEVFSTLDKVVADDAILASNTSAIPIMKLAMATGRPEQVVGLHFFSPVPVLTLVELVSSLLTSEETAAATQAFAEDVLGKRVIRAKDRAGFIVNALLIPYLISAIRMLESGFATAEDIDHGHGAGLQPPHGPAGPGRLHRPRHDHGRGREPVRGVQGAAVRPPAVALPHGRGRPPGTQDRPRLLRPQRPMAMIGAMIGGP